MFFRCPAAGQKHITSANFPKRVPLPVEKKDFRLRSGPIEVFKFQTGDEVQIKCLLLLCLTGKEAKCAQVGIGISFFVTFSAINTAKS